MKKVTGGQIITYGMGSLAKDLVGGMVSSYLLIFYTDVFGISAVVAGMIIMFTRLWDAINDPIMGVIVDKTNTKMGRYRPYILIAPILIALLYWLTFTTPGFENNSAKIVWAVITYTLAGMAFTAYDVPLWSMVPAISSDPNDRNKLITSQRTFTFLSYLIAMTFAYPLIERLGGGNGLDQVRVGYSRLLLIFGIVGIFFAWITFFTNKERVNIPKERPSFKRIFSVFVQNNHVRQLLIASLFLYIPSNIVAAVNIFFITHSLKRPDMIPLLMLIAAIGPIIGMLSSVFLAKKFGRFKAIIGGLCLAMVSNLILLMFGTNISILIPFVIIAGTGSGIPAVLLASLISDAADYTQWKHKIRIDGVIFSMNSFVIKLAMAIGTGLSGLLLNVVGYIPNAAKQAETTVIGINLIRFALPIVPLLIGLILFTRYKLDDATMEQCRMELTKEETINDDSVHKDNQVRDDKMNL